jgi:hypothetical protein
MNRPAGNNRLGSLSGTARMTTPINLNKVRKQKDREARKSKADENAVAFGRTKAERLLEAARAEQARKRLDSLKFDDE